MYYLIQCNQIMLWLLMILVLVATNKANESWEGDDHNNDDIESEERSRDDRRNSYSRFADEGASHDDASFEKTKTRKETESKEIVSPSIAKSNEKPSDISFPSDKIFVTTDKILASEKGFPIDKDFYTTDKNFLTDKGFPIEQSTVTTKGLPTFKSFTTERSIPAVTDFPTDTKSTDKSLPASTSFPTDEGFSANNKSLAKIKSDKNYRVNQNISPKDDMAKYEKPFTTNKSPTMAKPKDTIKDEAKPKVEQFTFWRNLLNPNATRRMFGGTRAGPDAAQGRAVALLDSSGAVHCSGAALTRMWVLTVAHCLSSSLKFVLASADVRHVPIRNLYYHRYHKAVQRVADSGGLAVTSLEHDIGLAEAVREMHIPVLPALHKILGDMAKHFSQELNGQEVSVYGFGRKEGVAQGAELFGIRTRVMPCLSQNWVPCVCSAGSRGVCVGDSGGPVFYKDAQVGVTSLGPMTCSPNEAHSSVFTTLQPYVPLLRSTVPAMPEFPNEPTPTRPSHPNPDDYWIKINIFRSASKASPCVVVTKLLVVVVPVAVLVWK